MSWRTIVITKVSKLDLKLNHMIVRQEETIRIPLNEIHTLLVESTAVSMTAALLVELMKRKIKVIFCDEKRNPNCEVMPYYGSHDTSAKVRNQIVWDDYTKKDVWREIVKEKIRNQMKVLKDYEFEEYSILDGYIKEVEHGDVTNREGHAAKVYFNRIFGDGFSRADDNPINAALNYGYSLLLSTFNREVVFNGYLTTLGIFHDNMFNQFNLSSDLMEVFRTVIDRCVIEMKPEVFGKEEKYQLVDLLNKTVIIDGRKQFLTKAIQIYTKSVLDAIQEKDVSLIRFYKDEL